MSQELHNLLIPLTEAGPPLGLSVLSYHALEIKDGPSFDTEDMVLVSARNETLALFEKHIGPLQDIIHCASRHTTMRLLDEIHNFNNPRHGELIASRYNEPNTGIEGLCGPKPDCCVWVGLFLGRAAEKESREELKEEEHSKERVPYENLNKIFHKHGKVHTLPILDVACNILRYIEEEAAEMDLKELLKFCAIYGLNGAIRNILEGKYDRLVYQEGEEKLDISINTPILFQNPKIQQYSRIVNIPHPSYPILSIAALLGHTHVVHYVIEELGADILAWIYLQGSQTNEQPTKYQEVGTHALIWNIKNNNPEMVKALTSVGVKYRWIPKRTLFEIFQLIFDMNDNIATTNLIWKDMKNYHPENFFIDRRSMRRYARKCQYTQKKKMLSVLISTGMPQELFFPTVDLTIDQKALKKAKDEGLTESNFRNSPDVQSLLVFSKNERKARAIVVEACCSYNVQCKEKKKMYALDFYNYINELWENQSSPQKAKLDTFESADSRWRIANENSSYSETAFESCWLQSEEDYEDSDIGLSSDNEVSRDELAGFLFIPFKPFDQTNSNDGEEDEDEDSEDYISEEGLTSEDEKDDNDDRDDNKKMRIR